MPKIAVSPETLALRELIDARRNEFRALLSKYRATNPRLFGSVARGTAHRGSDIDILVEMDAADGNLLMRASGLMEETRALFGRDDIDVFPVQLLKRQISATALDDAVALWAARSSSALPMRSKRLNAASDTYRRSTRVTLISRLWQRMPSSGISRSSAKR